MSGLVAGPSFSFPLCIWLMVKAFFPCGAMKYFIKKKVLNPPDPSLISYIILSYPLNLHELLFLFL